MGDNIFENLCLSLWEVCFFTQNMHDCILPGFVVLSFTTMEHQNNNEQNHLQNVFCLRAPLS